MNLGYEFVKNPLQVNYDFPDIVGDIKSIAENPIRVELTGKRRDLQKF